MEKRYTMDDFLEVVAPLRGENGCHWDKRQTHESLRPFMMEEAAELLASIRIYKQTGNAENMCEELGDILFQVGLHSHIAREEGLFTIEDVISGITEKMIRRHPHVFGNLNQNSIEDIHKTWDEIKKEEKAGQSWITSPLREIPQELPSLVRAVKVMKKVEKEQPGADYQETVSALKKQIEELEMYDRDTQKSEISNKMADIFMSLSRVSLLTGIQQEQVLYDRIEAYITEKESDLHK